MKESINAFEQLASCQKLFRDYGQSINLSDACYVDGNKIKDMSIEELESLLLELKGEE